MSEFLLFVLLNEVRESRARIMAVADGERRRIERCLEAVQNATKHAPRATSIRVTLTERDASLEIEVRDDGLGFDAACATPGSGLTNMRDRLAALDGRLQIHSAQGAGTRVLAALPLNSLAGSAGAAMTRPFAPVAAVGCGGRTTRAAAR